MKSETKSEMAGISPVSNDLYDEMFVHELENRLETDPLMANGLLDLVTTMDASTDEVDVLCTTCNILSSNNG